MRFDNLAGVRHEQTPAHAPLVLEEVTSLRELEALQGEWRWLWARSPEPTTQWPEWLLPWYRRAAPTFASLWVLTLRSEGRLAGFAPLAIREEEGARVVRLLGEGLPGCLDVLMDLELAPHGGVLLFEWLARHRQRWDTCVFEQLREGSPLLRTPAPAGFHERLESREWLDGLRPRRQFRRSLWIAPTATQ